MAKLTKAQRARLEKLAAYLEGLPEDYEHFDMDDYFSVSGAPERRYARKNGGVASCGAVACAVGHGPAAGILFPPRFVSGLFVDWNSYAGLFTGPWDEPPYAWAFHSEWSACDNSHRGAAARIRYLLDNGVPRDFTMFSAMEDFIPLYAPYRIDAKAQADA